MMPIDVRSYPGKRVLDLLILVVVALPVLIVCAVCAFAVKVTSRGPVLFKQARVGAREQRFELLKFRTMIDAPDNPLFPDDDRITSAGRWMRRFSLDELPQLWNVARGEMSIVGPRPTLVYQLDVFDERQRGRYRVVPGLTGLAQVRGRNAISWGERVVHDLEYVERISLWLDIRILLRTPFVIFGEGAEGHPTDDPLVRDGTISDLDE